MDTHTVGNVRHATALAQGIAAQGATRAGASILVQYAPVLLALMQDHNAAGELEERLKACAVQADARGNALFFNNRAPTRAECLQELDQDECGRPITRAMRLGQQKHVLALECAREVLEELWPAPFSIEQRHRFYPNAGFVETVSTEKEASIIAQGCTEQLWGSIKPDIVLHADRNLLKAALTPDFKFPCPESNQPRWAPYGASSPHSGKNQGEVYKEALGGQAMMISPREIVVQP
ncbi:hypothetical protein OV208_02325 [Corallococcus sp. bb12-1]|uniref:hypothetical protein n=1 Tax=Corallococcus sp. bb12-1 TaxID=2996784 RepID=UPI0022713D4B|nr:hypothetical protein [Corallococcus sp. bb12-1]MCY1040142.1 hypothetical protein [Corallococcus sp. bb12-1]